VTLNLPNSTSRVSVGSTGSTAAEAATETYAERWRQLVCGIFCMVMIANLQYGWTLFVHPIDQKFHWGTTAIQVAFSIFIAAETWLVPIEGWFVDRFGPRIVVAVGGVCVACAWTLNSFATSLWLLYAAAALAGIGAGAVYGTCVGNALKWFPDLRGLAAGLTAAGFGAGAAATVIPIREMILGYGYEAAFLWVGLGRGLVIVLLSRFLRAPRPGETPKPAIRVTHSLGDYTPLEILRSPVFWVLYFMFVMIAASGLMATAQLALISIDLGLAEQQVNILFMTATTLSAALVIDNILNGLARPFFGWVSDLIGREITMGVVFTIGAFAYWGAWRTRTHAVCVHRARRPGFLHVGRNLQLVSRDRDRYLWHNICHGQCGFALHRKGGWRFGWCRLRASSRILPAAGTGSLSLPRL
jgi:MFS transporter, OFA family, oxalate/formate antiporter